MSLVLKAQVATLDEGTGSEKDADISSEIVLMKRCRLHRSIYCDSHSLDSSKYGRFSVTGDMGNFMYWVDMGQE
ncbi:hypothetical protein Tco_0726654 [Tanacetum coccineum]|uniref:Uncharacterized protein n=1 Tax=Tanacetum coccineum TaxID=301880 RepID=A0ABQ4YJ44_9ASTR